ncbi:branched-chain amino acid ABC transporter permease [Jiella endophytica]|uniref:Branched-chain amino acid ABC transporter permease n=1 Tax=Jiella endophytica TaxID=2558362 RepID=A0A4Y8R8F7_9HYPH|nr:branched-chain amino acid ABC transporter permease [Jiella endophytica]TFF17680.1 branched-chain amino acid ABC transporter permease [Jiella endophytica]
MGAYGLFLVNGLAVGAIYALSGVGLVILCRATGVLNLAYGAIGAAGAMIAWQLMQYGCPEAIGWLAAIGTATLLSLAYGRLIAPHLSFREPVVRAVATLGFAIMILSLMNFSWVEAPRRLTLATDAIGLSILGMRVTGTRLIALLAAVLVTLAVALFLAATQTGLRMRALANDRDLAAVLGVPVVSVETVAWGISGVIAGFSGMMFADLVRLNPTVLTFLVIPAVAAAIVGRLESLMLTLAGGLTIGVVESMATLIRPVAPFRAAAPFVVAALLMLWYQRHRRLTFAGRD